MVESAHTPEFAHIYDEGADHVAPRCCGACGRWGNRSFRWDAENEWWVCRNDRACHRRIGDAARPMPAVRSLLADWDRTTNPIFQSAAGQLRQALRSDGRGDVAEVRKPPASTNAEEA